jgi:YjjG family noncanonical pyrimidine nucleotidase
MTLKGTYRLLMFDLDGTIVDYINTESRALHTVFNKYFSGVAEYGQFFDRFCERNEELWNRYRAEEVSLDELRTRRFDMLIDDFGLSRSSQQIARNFEKELGEEVVLFSDAAPALRRLRPWFELCLLTNGIAGVQREKLRRSGIERIFDYIIISEEVGRQKPARQFFEYALSVAGRKPWEALMIGDSLESDLLGSKRAKIDFCLVDRVGLDISEIFPRPDIVVRSLKDLTVILLDRSSNNRQPVAR